MFGKRMVSVFVALLSLLVVGIAPVWGQSTGTVVGTVTDNTGAVVVGAAISLVEKATGDTRGTTTNDDGHYIFANVNPGTYTVRFKKAGFSETVLTSVTVDVGTQVTENVQMKLGAVSTTVTVTETVGAELQTLNATIGTSITGPALDSLPAVGRDATTFLELQPGVSPDGSVAGAVVDQSTFMLDGGQNTNDMDGSMGVYTPSFASDTTGGLNTFNGQPTGVMPTPIDSIEEFKVNTANQTADFNSSAGAQVQMVTRRGTNAWHGTVYEYYLDNTMSANTWQNNLYGIPLPDFHYSRFGAAGGGPIISKPIWGGKTYFFANYQGWRFPNSETFTRAVPTQGMELGLLTDSAGDVFNLNPGNVTYPANAPATGGLVPGTIYPGSALDPRGIGVNTIVQTLWQNHEPLPNAGCGSAFGDSCDNLNQRGYSATLGIPENDNFGVARLDHDFGSKWHFMSSYRVYRLIRTTDSQVDIGGGFTGDKVGVPVATSARPQQPWYFVTGMTTNITPNLTNDFHYSYLRDFWQWGDNGGPVQPGVPTTGVLEPFGESNGDVLAPYNVNTQNIRTRFWDGKDNFFRDDLTLLHGNHLFQFGATYQHNYNYHQRTDNGGGINYTLTYQLGNADNGEGLLDLGSTVPAAWLASGASATSWERDYAAILGIVTSAQQAYTRKAPNLTLNPPLTPAFDQSRIPYYNFYFSDSWHLKPSLTLTYGLSWALELPPVEQNGKQVELVDEANQPLDVESYIKTRQREALLGQVYNPEVGFSLIGNTANSPKYPYDPFYGEFSPRLAVAWNPHFDSESFMAKIFGENSSVVRGGYSRVYGRLNGVDLVLVPLLGTGLIQPVQCLTPLSTGACGPATPTAGGPNAAFRIGTDGNTAPLPAAAATLPQPDFPGVNAATAAAGEALDPHFRPNQVDSFDLTIQRQFGPKMLLELGYIGRRITHEYQPININAVPYMMTKGGQTFAQAYAAVETALGCATSEQACGAAAPAGGSPQSAFTAYANTFAPQAFFENALNPAYCTANGYNSCTAAVVGNEIQTFNLQSQSVWSLWSDLDNGGATGVGNAGFNFPSTMLNTPSAIAPNGQLSSGVAVNASVGHGNYNGAFVSLKTTDWHGLTAQQNFTFSKSLGTGAFVQASSEYTPNDPYDLNNMYGYQNWDRKFVYNLFIVEQPPYFKGQEGVVGHILGGWNFSPIFTTGSGLPVYCNTFTDAQSFGSGDGSNFFDNEQCIFTQKYNAGHSAHFGVTGSGGVGTSTADLGVTGCPCKGAEVNEFADPAAVFATVRAPILGIDTRDNGVGPYHGQPYWNVDVSVRKTTKITERFSVETQFLFLNVFNHDQLGDPFLDVAVPSAWGVLNSQANSPRSMEFGLRLRF